MKSLILVVLILILIYKLNQNIKLDNKNILVMFSGGLDSTTALYYLLKYTTANIYIHHIKIDDGTNRVNEELSSCHKILKEFKKIRSFEYSESSYSYITNNIDKITKGSRQDDLSTLLYQSLRMCTVRNNLNIDYIVIADSKYEKHNKWDTYAQKFIDTMYYNHWYGKKPKMLDALTQFYSNKPIDQKLINPIKKFIYDVNLPYELHTALPKTELIYRFCKLTEIKKKMYYFIPLKIRKLVISCRNSHNSIKCGKCIKCKHENLYIN